MNYNKKIPIEQENISLIIKSFEDGEFEYFENFKEHPTVTKNGRGGTIWNHIHTQLVNNFDKKGFKTGIIERGFWELVYLFDEKTKYLYTFMRSDNFSNLHNKKLSDKLFHYSNVLSRLNGNLLGTYTPENQQLSFFDEVTIDVETDSKLESLLKLMLSNIDDIVERYAIVLVACKHGEVKNIECVIPIAYMNPMYREDWSEFVSAEYDTTIYHVEETLPEEEEMAMYNTDSDIILSVRSDDNEEKKQIN